MPHTVGPGSGSGAVPVDELHDHAVRVAHLERPLTPLLDGQRHGDRHALALEPGQLALQVVDDERQDQPGGVLVALVGGQGRQAAAAGRSRSCPASSRASEANPAAAISSRNPKCSDQERARRRDVLHVQRHGRRRDPHTCLQLLCTTYDVQSTLFSWPTHTAAAATPPAPSRCCGETPPRCPRRGPARAWDLDGIVDAAIGLADDGGLVAVTIRAVARTVGAAPMSALHLRAGQGRAAGPHAGRRLRRDAPRRHRRARRGGSACARSPRRTGPCSSTTRGRRG